ncbi:MAG: carbohydrate ABC transporter permease [Clostridiales bacterium]|uniref:carbohydrate ABC transporter permease n=1 Tax=Provencibacterium massiliense TaxID=1841868 RepID=UPI0009A6CE6D|nr:carbohydrate ABC transporter permease [Provencibacterium massiliense]PWM39479.1 MAG: carbohydrate ABC transporter permease [Clostridiales bacterium]RGB66276.1 carbohydrate ABC transporter permease [Harryflintia acetispora]
MKSSGIKLTAGQIVLRFLVILLFVVMLVGALYPMLWVAVSGFKSTTELLISPFKLPAEWSLKNYLGVWKIGISRFFLNSVFITVASSLLVATVSALAAFPLSRYRFRSRRFWFLFLLCGLMLAPQVSLISNYKILQALHLYDSYLGLILVYTAFRVPYTMFLMWSYFMTVPKDIEEAACIDGCTSFMIFWRILVPISKPIMATGILLTARYVWNDFLFSLIYTESAALKTIPYGLNSLKGESGTDWGQLMAGMAISSIPIIILFICTQKYFVRGLTVGAVKG